MSRINEILKNFSLNEAEFSRMSIQDKSIAMAKTVTNFVKKLPSEDLKKDFLFMFVDNLWGTYSDDFNTYWEYVISQRTEK